MCGWHNRGCVSDKVVTEWARDEDWRREGARRQTIQDKSKFVTFALQSVTHSTLTRIGKERKGKTEYRAPRILGPADRTIHIREEGPTVQRCGDSEVAVKWLNGQYALGQKCRGKNWPYLKDLYS